MTEIIENRTILLNSMNCVMLHMNDEEAYQKWIDTFPNAASEMDVLEIAEDDEIFELCKKEFENLIKKYIKNGIYCQ